MSLRRKSCDTCFRARRKCDLGFPVCGSCAKMSRQCQYAYPPQPQPLSDVTDAPLKTAKRIPEVRFGTGSLKGLEQVRVWQGPRYMSGVLGELPPVRGAGRWQLVHEMIGEFPLAFATKAETIFINRSQLEEHMSRPLRSAFGICAGSLSMTERSKPFLFKAIDAEVADLLSPEPKGERTLLDDLATLQAAVLYQTIRLYHGAVEHRMVAEQQEFLLRSYALTVLHRADIELQHSSRTWEMWILAESIRRTVLIVFKLYTMYWAFKKGVCFEIEGLQVLPVAICPQLWRAEAKDGFDEHPDADVVLTHEDFTNAYGANPPIGVDPFHDMLLLGCKQRPGETLDGFAQTAVGSGQQHVMH